MCECLTREGSVKVASLEKTGLRDIIRPSWLLDCVEQNELDGAGDGLLLPLEPRCAFLLLPVVQ